MQDLTLIGLAEDDLLVFIGEAREGFKERFGRTL